MLLLLDNFSKKFFQEHNQRVKQFGSRSGQVYVGPELGLNCLQRLSADDKSCPYSKKLTEFFSRPISKGDSSIGRKCSSIQRRISIEFRNPTHQLPVEVPLFTFH